MKNNILTFLLRFLKANHTVCISGQYFTEHPKKYNLFGCSSMLSDYSIKNAEIKVTNKNYVRRIDTPLMAHIASNFAFIENIDNLAIYVFLVILRVINNDSYKSLAVTFLLIISLVEVYIGSLLILKELKV